MILTSPDDLPPALAASVSDGEREFIQKLKTTGLPFAVTPHFASLAKPDRDDPIRRQFMPDPREEIRDPFASDDPLNEALYRVTKRLVHQYRDRALLLAGGSCAGFCRYCFRRVRMSSKESSFMGSFIGAEELAPVLAYLKSRPGIREILVSGGDPLTAEDGALEELFIKLRGARPDLLIRLCSRVPITNPARLKAETIRLFSGFKPLRIVTHINHPGELSPPACSGLAAAVEEGIPVHVQTVLLRGINDSADVLEELFRKCLSIGISPYYLFQLDLAPGIAHFRVPLGEGLSIYRDLERRLSGLGLPAYAVDPGGGKIRLHEGVIAGEEGEGRDGGRVLLLKDREGKLWKYPGR